jgi:uncharacterized protein (TIGR00369 family)
MIAFDNGDGATGPEQHLENRQGLDRVGEVLQDETDEQMVEGLVVNPTGNGLGAFVAAMLYDTVGPTLLATLEPDQFQSTLELNVNFLRPVRPGRIVGKGRLVHRDGDIVFLAASLTDSQEKVIATATAMARIIALERARDAA